VPETTTIDEVEDFVRWLYGQYSAVRVFDGYERYAALESLMLGQARIVVGQVGDRNGFDVSYNFETYVGALKALAAWQNGPDTEPSGWLRRCEQGRPTRRRPDGDATREYESP
jgi:hypothetical protein